MSEINSFSGDWDFLSNFYDAPVLLDAVNFRSVEHAYQAAKSLDPQKREVLSLEFNPTLTAAKAKRIGRNLKLRDGWDDMKVGYMRHFLMQKFAPLVMRRKLLSTGTAELIEGNWWHDVYWGVCMHQMNGKTCDHPPHNPKGENHLGLLLMEIRGILGKWPVFD